MVSCGTASEGEIRPSPTPREPLHSSSAAVESRTSTAHRATVPVVCRAPPFSPTANNGHLLCCGPLLGVLFGIFRLFGSDHGAVDACGRVSYRRQRRRLADASHCVVTRPFRSFEPTQRR